MSEKSIFDVVARQLCSGCGVCAYLAPQRIEMVDDLTHGRRPVEIALPHDGSRDRVPDSSLRDALEACPGVGLVARDPAQRDEVAKELLADWGTVYDLYEGYAGDDELRFLGSSGGAASALALFGLERGGMHGVLQIAARDDVKYLNRTQLSTTRAEILAATGSRYAPASPCDGLALVENAKGPCAVIGKPCDIAATENSRRLRPELDRKIGFTVAFFCAGTPSLQGTFEMLRQMGVKDPESVVSLRYRGRGWPGMASAAFRDDVSGGAIRTAEMTYEKSWGDVLQKHRPWRCHVCVDHSGEFADIAVGDPWYRTLRDGEPGRSLVLARTERGRRILAAAVESGHLVLEKVGPEILLRSQPNMLRTRATIFGRVLASRASFAAAPRYRGFSLFSSWWRVLTPKEKAQSIYGTLKRVFTRGLLKRIRVERFEPRRQSSPPS